MIASKYLLLIIISNPKKKEHESDVIRQQQQWRRHRRQVFYTGDGEINEAALATPPLSTACAAAIAPSPHFAWVSFPMRQSQVRSELKPTYAWIKDMREHSLCELIRDGQPIQQYRQRAI